MSQPVVFDVETQNSFREVHNDVAKLRISVAVAYDYQTKKTYAFTEDHIGGLFTLFEKASVIIGFNSNSFDLAVLAPYYVGDLMAFSRFDLLESVKEKTGKRYPLDDLVKATLGKGKSGHGLHAIELFREGKMDELTSYCTDDVTLTQELFDFGVNNGYIYLPTVTSKIKIFVDWRRVLDKKQATTTKHNLTLGF